MSRPACNCEIAIVMNWFSCKTPAGGHSARYLPYPDVPNRTDEPDANSQQTSMHRTHAEITPRIMVFDDDAAFPPTLLGHDLRRFFKFPSGRDDRGVFRGGGRQRVRGLSQGGLILGAAFDQAVLGEAVGIHKDARQPFVGIFKELASEARQLRDRAASQKTDDCFDIDHGQVSLASN